MSFFDWLQDTTGSVPRREGGAGSAGDRRQPRQPAGLRGYIIAILAGVLAILIRRLFDPILGVEYPYIISMLAVIFVAWEAGFGPAVLTAALGAVATTYWFVPPRGSWAVERLPDQVGLGVFAFSGVACGLLGESQRQARLRAEQALAEARAREAELEAEVARREKAERGREQLVALVESSSDLVGLAGLDGRVTYFNDAGLRLLGLDSLAAARGKTLFDFVMPEDADALRREMLPALDREGRWEGEWRYRQAKTGRPVPVSKKVALIRDPRTGEPTAYATVSRDVTEQKRAEEAVRESEARFRSMADSVPVLIWVSELDRRRTYFNKFWLDFTGRPLAEQLGAGWAEGIHPADRDRYRRTYESAFETRTPFELEYRLRRHDGEYRWVLARGTPRFTPGGEFAGFVGLCIDITDRKTALEQLRESEEWYRVITEVSPQMVWMTRPDGYMKYNNQYWFDYTGFTPAESDGDGWLEAVRPDDRDRVAAAWRAAVTGGDGFEAEIPFRRHDGEYRWFLARGRPVRDDAGRVTKWLGVALDVHDRRVAAEAVRASEERFRTLAEAVPPVVWVAGPDGGVEYLNPRWAEFTGAAAEDALGDRWLEFVHPADREPAAEAWRAAVAAGAGYETQYRLRRHDGEYHWFLARGTPQRDPDGRVVRWFGTCTDIHETRRLAEQLQQSLDRFRVLTETIPQLVWTAAPDGQCDYLSRQWAAYTGVPDGDLLGDRWLNVVHPDDRDRLTARWQRSVRTGAAFDAEFRIRGRDGTHRWFKARAVPSRDDGGAVVKWIGTNTDIDDQKRQAETLERLVRDRTAELQRSNGELEQFAYVASHDLQEPLRKIQAFGGRLGEKYRERLGDQGREYLDRMLASAGRMARLIDDLLTFSRVTTQARPFTRVDLNAVLADVLDDLAARVEQTGAEVDVGPLPEVDADPMQMRQLFQNLVGNALKFSKPGERPLVRVRGELADGPPGPPSARLTVEDRGIGFDEKYLDRIFQVFQRLHGRGEYEGTGVGLAICKKIVDRHGGEITARSRPGEGAEFVVTLPLRHADDTDHQTPRTPGEETYGQAG